MTAYVSTILTISVVGGIVSSIAPGERTKKHINLIIGLIATIILITPIVKIAGKAEFIKDSISSVILKLDNEENLDSANKIIINTTSQRVCQGIKQTVATKFKIEEDSIKVSAKLDESNPQAIIIERIDIILLDKATWLDSQEVKEYAQDLTGCRVTITKR